MRMRSGQELPKSAQGQASEWARTLSETKGPGEGQKATPAQAFGFAVAHHRAGRLGEAEAIYRAILNVAPDHTGALHYLGLALLQQNKIAAAEAFLQRAIACDPTSAEAQGDLGNLLQMSGRAAEALQHYQAALAIQPSSPELFNNMGNAYFTLGRHEEAIAQYRQALTLRHDFAEAHNNLGLALARLGGHGEARDHYAQAVALRADYLEARINLASACVAAGDPAAAVIHFESALGLRPESPALLNDLGNALTALGRPKEALPKFAKALSLEPDFKPALIGYGNALLALDRISEASAQFDHAQALDPLGIEALIGRGNVLTVQGRYEDALAVFETGLARAPQSPQLHNGIGYALLGLHRDQEAHAAFERALRENPVLADAMTGLGYALQALEQPDQAILWFERALAIAPALAAALLGLGRGLQAVGRLAESQISFAAAVAHAPEQPAYYEGVIHSRRVTSGDPYLVRLEELAERMTSYKEDDQIGLHFMLGKAYADIGDHARSFEHLAAGNALKYRQLDFDDTVAFARFERTKAVFTAEIMHAHAGSGHPSDLPIFVLGMPRSGTTLTEQMLASHPQIFGAGELRFIPGLARTFDWPGSTGYPDAIANIDGGALHRFGRRYIEAIRPQAPTAARITDKLPFNFFFAGLIHLALPNARIVHMRRHPIDNCMSIFALRFGEGFEWSYDLGQLGRYYRAYHSLMQHWQAVLPAGAMLDVSYEAMVDDFETEARRILAYCGLDWDDRCLTFHETKRPVLTASVTQVRQPLYRSSIGRWQPYADRLGPLFEALGTAMPRG